MRESAIKSVFDIDVGALSNQVNEGDNEVFLSSEHKSTELTGILHIDVDFVTVA